MRAGQGDYHYPQPLSGERTKRGLRRMAIPRKKYEKIRPSAVLFARSNKMEEVIHNILGGSVTTRPAGQFKNEQGEIIDYQDAVVATVGRKSITLPPAHAIAIYEAIRDSKNLKIALGIKEGLFA